MAYDTKNIRNVVLLGHSGSGKTTFAETMLFESGAINRRGTVEGKSTISDYSNIEQERGNSIFSTLMHAKWKDSKINIIDTPGFDDFVGEVIASLQERFGARVLPFQFPYKTGIGFNKIVDALRMIMYHFPDGGGKPIKEAIPEAVIEKAQEMHNALVEAAAENDEDLMELFFENGSLTEEELTKGLKIALAAQEIFPLFCCSATRNMGSGRIMGFINDIAPSPADRPEAPLENGESLKCDANYGTSIFIYKTISEPQVGKLSYFKVYSGTLKSSDELENTHTRTTERFNQLFVSEGKNRIATNQLCAGDIGVTTKLKNSHTNQTLNKKGVNREIKKMHFPPSRIRTAFTPPSKNDMEKLMKALHVIESEDPTLKVELAPHLKQTLLHGQGQLHLDIIKYRIEKVNNVSMEFIRPRIAYRETITRKADDSYRHKKQSGGSGQFAEVHMRIAPYVEGMPQPSDLTVRKEEIDELPWKYINAIKKGIMQKMEEGPLTGSRCQDIRVCVYDGKMHPVDSNDMAFMIASAQVFKNAFQQAAPQLLEPIYNLEVLCSSDVMGDVMGDLQTRRAMIMGMDSEGHYQKIMAKVPVAEMYKYSSSLRSLSQGKAKFSRSFSEFQAVTPGIQKALVNAYKNELQEA